MIALDPVKQMETIEARVSAGLQAYASGEDSLELINTLMAVVAGIYVEIHDCDAGVLEQIYAFTELMGQLEEDRKKNIKVYFEFPAP